MTPTPIGERLIHQNFKLVKEEGIDREGSEQQTSPALERERQREKPSGKKITETVKVRLVYRWEGKDWK